MRGFIKFAVCSVAIGYTAIAALFLIWTLPVMVEATRWILTSGIAFLIGSTALIAEKYSEVVYGDE